MNNSAIKPARILLIDDNPMDIELTLECFEESKILADIETAGNGLDAFEVLKSFLPDIILLDLNMPKMDGREFLKLLKQKEEYKHIPVVVLTTSEANKDIITSYNMQASAYLSKPVRYDEFVKMMKKFDEFYLSLVKLPKK